MTKFVGGSGKVVELLMRIQGATVAVEDAASVADDDDDDGREVERNSGCNVALLPLVLPSSAPAWVTCSDRSGVRRPVLAASMQGLEKPPRSK